ncbi:MAG: hypothetical protein WD009_03500 [Phycisphaeraceae bacterium]
MKAATLLLAVTVIMLLPACASGSSTFGRPVMDDNGQWLAFLTGEEVSVPWFMKHVRLREQVSFHWAPVDDLEQVRRIEVADRGIGESCTGLLGACHFRYAPDGRHVAIVTPQGIRIVDLAGGAARWLLADSSETVGSLQWMGDGELVYASYRWPEDANGHAVRTFWRQRIDAEERQVVHRDDQVRFGVWPRLLPYNFGNKPNEFWSSDGRSVLFRGSGRDGEAHLLQIETGELQRIGNGVPLRQASWNRRRSQVFWYGWERGGDRRPRAFSLNVVDGEIKDLSESFERVFGQSEV